MAILQIKKYPEKILRQKTEKITRLDDKLIKLSKDMLETMYFFNGIGLAANQVGELKSVFVSDIKPDGMPACPVGRQKPVVLFNPEILFAEGNCLLEEGCLSFPGITTKIKRPEKIVVSGITADGKEVKIEVNGLTARVFQHEIDHLNGIVLLDRINMLKRWKLKKAYLVQK